MTATLPRFLQIHTLTAYPGTLLNRDDAGMAKRLPVGGHTRIRVSSQCLKRHWRRHEGEHALGELGAGLAFRSREIFVQVVRPALLERGLDPERVEAVLAQTLVSLLGESDKTKTGKAQNGKAKKAKDGDGGEEPGRKDDPLKTRQVIVLGRPEVNYLIDEATRLAAEAKDADDAKKKTEAFWKARKENAAALRSVAEAGIDAALFGRMVTSDLLARSDAAIHVAHAFTVNAEAEETDYFSAVDDLVQETGALGSGHINSSELTAGLFYGYVVVDLPLLVSNLTGCDRRGWEAADRELAAEVVRRLLHLIATVSPGAKKGSTAPYAWADLLLVEAGTRQPRTLANAFASPVTGRKAGLTEEAVAALAGQMGRLDGCYGVKEARAYLATVDGALPAADDLGSLDAVADWAAALVRGGR